MKRVKIRGQKCICIYVAGHYIGLDYNRWKNTLMGQRISEYLEDPKFQMYMKSIFIDSAIRPWDQPTQPYIMNIMKRILKSTYKRNDRENISVYCNCSLCTDYCTVNFVNKWNNRIIRNWILCPFCHKYMLG